MRTPSEPPDPVDSSSCTALALACGHQLILETGRNDRSLVHLRGPQGIHLTIEVTEAGPVLRFDGPGLSFHTAGALAISAETVSIHGRQGLSLTAGGDVQVTANDDVKLNGERVLLNC